MLYYGPYFADVYGTGNYNSQVYSSSTSASTSTSGSSGSPLANTGFDIILGVTIACIVIFAALLVRFWKKPKKQQEPNQ